MQRDLRSRGLLRLRTGLRPTSINETEKELTLASYRFIVSFFFWVHRAEPAATLATVAEGWPIVM